MAQYELNIQDYVRILKKRRWIIILTAVSIIGSVIIFTNMETPIYQASATVKVEASLVIPGVGVDQAGWDMVTALNTEVKIIKSEIVAKRTAIKLNLLSSDMSQQQIENIVNTVESKINADRVGDTNLVSISATSSDPKETADIANAAAEVYIEKGIEDRNKRAKELREFIENQSKDAEAKLRQTEDVLRKYTEKSGAKGIGGYMTGQLMELQNKKSELLKRYTNQHPEVQKITEQIESVEEQMKKLPAEELEYARLQRDVTINEELYTLLAKRFKDAQISEADRVQSAFIITPAVMPSAPIKPNRMMNIATGIFLGIFLGFVFALAIENLDTSIGTIEDVEKYLELPVLGIVPHIDIDNKLQALYAGKSSSRGQKINQIRSKLVVYQDPKSPFVEAYHTLMTNMKFVKGDNGKLGGKTILFTSAGIGEGKTITSSNFALAAAQSGLKTIIVEADLRRPSLHWIFGLSRGPGFSDCIIGQKNWRDVIKGTTDFIMSDMGSDKILHYPGIENLSLLTSGNITPNPIDMLNSPDTIKILKEMSEVYDLVILDCPPVLLFADALILGSHASGSIIVYQVGRMARRALKRAKDQMTNVKAPVIGIVLNNVRTTEIGSYYGYGYQYSYKYYSKDVHKDKTVAS